jgi:hypothetical protein
MKLQIKKINFDDGILEIHCFNDDGQPERTLFLSTPYNEHGILLDTDSLINYIKEDLQYVIAKENDSSRQPAVDVEIENAKLREEYNKLIDQEIQFDDIDSNKGANKNSICSQYGNLSSINTTRRIVIDTLRRLNILK